MLNIEQLINAQNLALRIPIADHLVKMVVRLVRSSRPKDLGAPDYIREMVNWGAGPRASQNIVRSAKARAVLDGRFSVAEEDIRQVAPEVLCHRIVANYNAEAENVSPKDIVSRLLKDLS